MGFGALNALLAAATALSSPHAAVNGSAIGATSWHGGPQHTAGGEIVTVYVSDAYPDGGEVAPRWAAFFASLVHGPELASLRAYVTPETELVALCGASAAGCYNGDRLVFDGTDELGVPPEAVAAHEYGHHVAANRSNPPWRAAEWGPKRWASAADVCSRVDDGLAFPGDEDRHYDLNPGEAWAETFRVLNGAATGADPDWPIVSTTFLPDADALAAARRDVVEPWRQPAAQTVVRRFRAHGPATWSTSVSAPLDGDVRIQLSFPVAAAFAATARYADGVVATAAQTGTGKKELSFRVCGRRSFVLQVVRQRGAGSVRVRIEKP